MYYRFLSHWHWWPIYALANWVIIGFSNDFHSFIVKLLPLAMLSNWTIFDSDAKNVFQEHTNATLFALLWLFCSVLNALHLGKYLFPWGYKSTSTLFCSQVLFPIYGDFVKEHPSAWPKHADLHISIFHFGSFPTTKLQIHKIYHVAGCFSEVGIVQIYDLPSGAPRAMELLVKQCH